MKKLLLVLLALTAGMNAFAQFVVSGTLKDSSTGEAVGFATISITPDGATKPSSYVLSDSDGSFRLSKIRKGKYTVVFCLLGKNEQQLRERLATLELSSKNLANIHCWEVGFGCIWPEEFVSIMKRYITRWKNRSSNKHLHLIIDDFANINVYPLMEREPLLVPALVTLCQNATFAHGYEDNDKGIDIELSLVCTSKDSKHYNVINELSNNK